MTGKGNDDSNYRWMLTEQVLEAGLKIGDSIANKGCFRISEKKEGSKPGALEDLETHFSGYSDEKGKLVKRESTFTDRNFLIDPKHSKFIDAIKGLVEKRTHEIMGAEHPQQTQAPHAISASRLVSSLLGGSGNDRGFSRDK